mmetsp:Transcript_28956/g.60273  ORF Transcript_28956/g.60273 Transcript_28956/m.60273 type:complete len:963 (-) Transcript_28956:226-3114(-)
MNQTVFARSGLLHSATPKLTAAEETHRKEQATKRRAKRKKPTWKERVAPVPNDDEPKEDIIDEAMLTRCTRCPVHRNRNGRFRPLIGNGEYMCDSCYQTEFPATAMLDEDKPDKPEWQRIGKRASANLRNKIVDTAADIMGITRTAPDEHEQGGKDDSYPSELECSGCLERGVFRRCCSTYYCHSCFYKSGRCPGCEIEAHLTGVAALKPDPGKLAVGISWVLSVLLIVITAVGLALAYFNASTTPTTLWGHVCWGWFPVCDLTVCIDYDGGIGYGEGNGFIPASQPYKICDRESSANQVVGSSCVYDRELYTWSNHLLGYDICVSSPREENVRPMTVSSSRPLLLYSNSQGESGVYIFDDDFEQPSREASAPWTEIINGERSSACGINSQAPERGNHGGFGPLQNKNALVFSGVQTRHATTGSLDVEQGGMVEFFIKLGPIVTDEGISECKTAFSDVTLAFRSSPNGAWRTFGTYPAWKYRGEGFQFVSQSIPTIAWGKSTQFQFRQESFDNLRDHWAIDDVRIWANHKPEWRESAEFKERRDVQNANVKLAQCCYNTDQCTVFDKKDTKFDHQQCDRLPSFDRSRSSSRLKMSELLILYLCLVAGVKALYWRVVRRFGSIQTEENNNTADSGQTDLFPRQTYYAISHLLWQYTVASILLMALSGIIYQLYNADVLSWRSESTFTTAACCAAFFDVRTITVLLVRVFCVERPWRRTPLEVVVDLHPDKGFMRVGKHDIPLSEVSDIKREKSIFYWIFSLGYTLAGLPVALSSLSLQSFDLPLGLQICAPVLGCVAIVREIFGPSLFVKLFLSVQWILTLKQQDRDDLGRAVRRKGLLQQFIAGSTLAPVVIMFSLLGRRVEDVSAGDNFMLFLVCAVFGGLFGLLIGIMHGLPVVPDAKLKGWPSTCCCVLYYDRVNCPCLFSCTYCGEIHSRQTMVVLAVDDMNAFKRILQGGAGNMPSR